MAAGRRRRRRRRGRRRIPEATVARLPVYLRSLLEVDADGQATISSERLAEMAGVNAAKVRKDLSLPRAATAPGASATTSSTCCSRCSRELGLTHDWPVVIVGVGNLGQALANYGGFGDRGFPVRGAGRRRRRPGSASSIGDLAIDHVDDLPRDRRRAGHRHRRHRHARRRRPGGRRPARRRRRARRS